MSDPVPIFAQLGAVHAYEPGAVLPPHHPGCLGCGPDSPQGFHLQVRREGDDVVAEHVFEPRHQGAPGIAHGGTVATVVDDLMGFVLYVVRVAAVTRHLSVDYLRPVLVGPAYALRGTLEARDGRKLWMACTGTGPDGVPAFTARALFLAVDASHFAVPTAGPGRVVP